MNNKETEKYNGWTNYETWRVNLEMFDGMSFEREGGETVTAEFCEDYEKISAYWNSFKGAAEDGIITYQENQHMDLLEEEAISAIRRTGVKRRQEYLKSQKGA